MSRTITAVAVTELLTCVTSSVRTGACNVKVSASAVTAPDNESAPFAVS